MSILCDTCTCSRKCGECTVKECRKSLDFTVIGTPKGKGRPRFTSAGGRAMAYTPKATKEAEEAVKEAFSKAFPGVSFGSTPVAVRVKAYMPIPKNASHAQKAKMLSDIIRHTHKPDADNILKLVCDALNGLAFDDDKQIIEVWCEKAYSDVPRTEISVIRIGGDNNV